VDLTDRVEADGLSDDLVEGLVEAGTLEGELYGTPWYAGVRSVVYNIESLEEAGMEPPENWQELGDAVATLNAPDSATTPLPSPGASEFSRYPWVWGNGGEVATQEGEEWVSTINSPEAVEGIKFFTDLALEHDSSNTAAATWD